MTQENIDFENELRREAQEASDHFMSAGGGRSRNLFRDAFNRRDYPDVDDQMSSDIGVISHYSNSSPSAEIDYTKYGLPEDYGRLSYREQARVHDNNLRRIEREERLEDKRLERKEAREERKLEKMEDYFMRPATTVKYSDDKAYDTSKKFKKYDGGYEHAVSEPQVSTKEDEEEIDLFDELEGLLCEQVDQGEDKYQVLQDALDRFQELISKFSEKYDIDMDDHDDNEEMLSYGNVRRCSSCGIDISDSPPHHQVCRRCY